MALQIAHQSIKGALFAPFLDPPDAIGHAAHMASHLPRHAPLRQAAGHMGKIEGEMTGLRRCATVSAARRHQRRREAAGRGGKAKAETGDASNRWDRRPERAAKMR